MPRSFTFGPFFLDPERGSLTRESRPVAVGHKGFLLLNALVQQPGTVVTKSQLIQAAWPDLAVEDSNLSVQIAALRKLLGPQSDGSDWITTVSRVGYRFAGAVQELSAATDRVPAAKEPLEPRPRPSIAILPFASLSGPEQEYLADGISEDIIIALTRFRWFRVIGRNSSFAYKGRSIAADQIAHELDVRYVLNGSVRRSPQQIRISVQLSDAASGGNVWAERYDVAMTEAFAVQDAIAERIVGAVEPEMLKAESLPGSSRHSGNVTAWELVRQGTWQFHQIVHHSHLSARELFRKACAIDPYLAEGPIWLARVSAGLVAYGWSDNPSQDIMEGLDAALKAIRLDDKNPYSHYALAICSAYGNAPEQAVLAGEKAIELAPSFALGHLVLGMAHLFRGSAAEAIPPLQHGLTLNVHGPQNFVWYDLLALAHLIEGDAASALEAATRSRKVRPSWRPTYEILAVCCAELGQDDQMQACVQAISSLDVPPGDALQPVRRKHPHFDQRLRSLFTPGC